MFVLLVAYAVFGNIAVYFILIRRGVPVRFIRAGTPGYLARLCAENTPAAGPGLIWFARSTNIAFIACFFLGMASASRR